MAEELSVQHVEDEVCGFIRTQFLAGDPQDELTLDTELLRLGILDSLDTTRLIAFIRRTFGFSVPFEQLTASNMGSVRRIAAMICSVADVHPAVGELS